VIFGVESLPMHIKNVTTQNQQIHFAVKCKAFSLSLFSELTIRRKGRLAHAFPTTPVSATNHIVCVTVVYIIYSRISSPGINDTDLSDF
jgi:hypothetical protein